MTFAGDVTTNRGGFILRFQHYCREQSDSQRG